jgi:hypothetical protein
VFGSRWRWRARRRRAAQELLDFIEKNRKRKRTSAPTAHACAVGWSGAARS